MRKLRIPQSKLTGEITQKDVERDILSRGWQPITSALEQPYDIIVDLGIDFEEEKSSPGLPEAVANYQTDLMADMLLILDGPMHFTGKPTLVFGNRGIASITLKTFGPKTPQHSGHYGNYIPNPALRLSQILSSMKNEDGKVVIPGFYEGIILNEDIKKILEAFPKSAHPMGILSSLTSALTAFNPSSKHIDYDRSKSELYDTIVKVLGKIPVLIAWTFRKKNGLPLDYGDSSLGYVENILKMMFNKPNEQYVQNPVLVNSLNKEKYFFFSLNENMVCFPEEKQEFIKFN